MTRGREQNLLHVVAEDEAGARAQFIEAMARDRADRGLTDATERATEAVAGLTNDGPVQFVNEEITALLHRAQTAEAQAERWEQVGTALTDLRKRETVVRERARVAEEAAKQYVAEVRTQVAAPLVSAAEVALSEWQDASAEVEATADQVRSVSWFGKHRARTDHETAQARAQQARQHLTDEWGVPPKWNEKSEAWVQRVTGPLVDGDPRVSDAEHEHREARAALVSRPERAQMARLAAYARVFGIDNVLPNRQASSARIPSSKGYGRRRPRSRRRRKPSCSLTSPRLRRRRGSSRPVLSRPLARRSVPSRSAHTCTTSRKITGIRRLGTA